MLRLRDHLPLHQDLDTQELSNTAREAMPLLPDLQMVIQRLGVLPQSLLDQLLITRTPEDMEAILHRVSRTEVFAVLLSYWFRSWPAYAPSFSAATVRACMGRSKSSNATCLLPIFTVYRKAKSSLCK